MQADDFERGKNQRAEDDGEKCDRDQPQGRANERTRSDNSVV
jgi:hypothetical protein